VWNRSEERTKPLIHEGAIAAAAPAEAELDSDAVISMLLDDTAYDEGLFGDHRLVDVFSPGVLHILCGTISMAFGARLTLEHANRGIDFVGAQVSGRVSDAEDGRLWIIAAGADQAVNRARPLLETFSRGITVVGKEPQQAYATRAYIGTGSPTESGAPLRAGSEAVSTGRQEGSRNRLPGGAMSLGGLNNNLLIINELCQANEGR
jgi:3-hydroxyisobutyrate dehydrogenase-like beta-hydroxyacid dehydrogenase